MNTIDDGQQLNRKKSVHKNQRKMAVYSKASPVYILRVTSEFKGKQTSKKASMLCEHTYRIKERRKKKKKKKNSGIFTLEVARFDLAVTGFIDDIGTALVAKVTTLGVVMVLVCDTLMVGVDIIRLMPCCCCC